MLTAAKTKLKLLIKLNFQIFYDDNNVATLIIKEVFPEDAGSFTCVAKNAAGFASSTTELFVEAPLSDHGSEIVNASHSRRSLSRYILFITLFKYIFIGQKNKRAGKDKKLR
jgi:hypothetical protein